MIQKLKDWFDGNDVKYLYRLNRISLQEAELQIGTRQMLVYLAALAIILTIASALGI